MSSFRLGPDTANALVDVFIVVLIFFAARWQARDVYNNLKISLVALLVMGVLFYMGTYLALNYAVFRGQGAYGKSKAVAITTAVWAFMWLPIWGSIVTLSAPSPVTVKAGDSMLVTHVPESNLARGVKNTSLSGCNRLVACERSPAQANYKNILDKRKSCEACIAKGECPSYQPDGSIACVPAKRGRCDKPCLPADMLERYASNKRCPNAVAYATATGDPSSIEQMCAEDRGMCVYGCDDVQLKGSGALCASGWRSFEREDMGTDLAALEARQGYPSRRECERHHARCADRECASAPLAPPDQYSNCYCSDTFAPTNSSAPCTNAERLCDRTSPQYLAALAVSGSASTGQAIKSSSQSDTAARVRNIDASLSNAIMF